MKPEALDALTTKTMRPKALDAVAEKEDEERSPGMNSPAREQIQSHQDRDAIPVASTYPGSVSKGNALSKDSNTEDTPTAASIVSEVVQGVKTAVNGAIAWAEQKVDKLSAEQDSTGPYTSPATCMPSDLDVIASGILPAMPSERQSDGAVEGGIKEADSTEKSTKSGDREDREYQKDSG